MNKTQVFSQPSLRWPAIRLTLLSLTLFGILGVLLKVILFPAPEEKKINNNFVFPDTVPLSGWQLNKTKELTAKPSAKPALAAGKIYQYENQEESLEVEVRSEKYYGNINRFFIIYRKMPAATLLPTIKYKKDIGHYGIFNHQDKAYLSACINPQGESTATQQQFNNNRYLNGLGIQRTFLWLIGQQDLLDGRCLWTMMLVPISSYDPYQIILEKDLEDEYQKLETAWVQWYQWWKANFPSY